MNHSEATLVEIFIPADDSVGCYIVEEDPEHGAPLGRYVTVPKHSAHIGIPVDVADKLNGVTLVAGPRRNLKKRSAQIKYRKVHLLSTRELRGDLIIEWLQNSAVSPNDSLASANRELVLNRDNRTEVRGLRSSLMRRETRLRLFFRGLLKALIAPRKEKLDPPNDSGRCRDERCQQDFKGVCHSLSANTKTCHGPEAKP